MPDAAAIAPPFRFIAFDSLGSTNQDGLERARQGDPGWLWIRAGIQTQGRGRIGRPWSSPFGNLYTSLLLVDLCDSRVASQLGFVAGVALASAVRRLPSIPDEMRLKWPNDLVFRGAKLAGLLVEGSQDPSGVFTCVIGFGVNCVSHPSGLEYPTTDLSEMSGHRQSADDLAEALALDMAATLTLWDRGRDFAAVRERWLALALPNGTPLTVKSSSSRMDGFFDTVDDLGRLRLSTPAGTLVVDAADVFPTALSPTDPVTG